MTQIEVTRLSSKEKALVQDKGRNFDPIIIKLVQIQYIGIIKIQIKYIDE